MSSDTSGSYLWAEPLPSDCPPKDAISPNNDSFYRLVNSFPPNDEDFHSHRKLYPNKPFHANECVARSCSVFSSLQDCNKIRKLPRHKEKRIVKLILTPKSGLIMQRGRNKYHYSWWRTKIFDPISNCIEAPRINR